MYNRVDYTDHRDGTRKTAHIVGNGENEVRNRLFDVLKVTNQNQVTIHSISNDQPDFMQHEFEALSNAIGSQGENRDVLLIKMMSEITSSLGKISSFQSKILEELQKITSRMDE